MFLLFCCRSENEIVLYFDGLQDEFYNKDLLIDIQKEERNTYALPYRLFIAEINAYNEKGNTAAYKKLRLYKYSEETYFNKLVYDSFKKYLNEEDLNVERWLINYH